mmetsp:Transcript_14875/g.18821  ORF Transcript_14875/g.18821 Transcript_14875/m.18821 type:complete len:127 (+) Transcript_14875:42-422(+)
MGGEASKLRKFLKKSCDNPVWVHSDESKELTTKLFLNLDRDDSGKIELESDEMSGMWKVCNSAVHKVLAKKGCDSPEAFEYHHFQTLIHHVDSAEDGDQCLSYDEFFQVLISLYRFVYKIEHENKV